MSLISAGLKYIGRSINDALYRHDLKNVHNKSFNDTKAKINASRRKGYINGAKTYRRNYDKNLAIAKAKYNNRDKFISDL